MKLQWSKAEKAIKATDLTRIQPYLTYWLGIKPKTHLDYFYRWLFAFASIRTTWQTNCKVFLALKALGQYFNMDDLDAALRAAGAGMYAVRTRAIWEFNQKYWADPAIWYPQRGETFVECRTRCLRTLHGIGLAKSSFVFEMCWPERSEVVCLDTHILALYGIRGNTASPSVYRDIERHWITLCRDAQLPSPIVRHIYWDKLQKQKDTRYWSYVFHRPAYTEVKDDAPTTVPLPLPSPARKKEKSVARVS